MQFLSAVAPAYLKMMNTSLKAISERKSFAELNRMFVLMNPWQGDGIGGGQGQSNLPAGVCCDCRKYLHEYFKEVLHWRGSNKCLYSSGQRPLLLHWGWISTNLISDEGKELIDSKYLLRHTVGRVATYLWSEWSSHWDGSAIKWPYQPLFGIYEF